MFISFTPFSSLYGLGWVHQVWGMMKLQSVSCTPTSNDLVPYQCLFLFLFVFCLKSLGPRKGPVI